MKTNLTVKLIAGLLSLVMLFSMSGVPVFAEEHLEVDAGIFEDDSFVDTFPEEGTTEAETETEIETEMPDVPDEPAEPEEGYKLPDGIGFPEPDEACDHTVLHREMFDMSEYGACIGVFYCDVCECGKVKYYRHDMSACENCVYGETLFSEIYTDADGVEVFVDVSTCRDCGIEIGSVDRITRDGCKETYVHETFYAWNGEIVLGGIFDINEGDFHQNEEWVTFDLAEYGVCGGTFEARYCSACDKIIHFMRPDFSACDMRVEYEDSYNETYDYYHHEKCTMCGVEFLEKHYHAQIESCTYNKGVLERLSINGTVIAECVDDYVGEEHSYEITKTCLGETCADGFRTDYTCTECGNSYYSLENRCQSHYRYEDLSMYGACGGTIEIRECRNCGAFETFYRPYLNACANLEQLNETTVDPNGNECTLVGERCADCGIEWTLATIRIVGEGCETLEMNELTVEIGGETLFERYYDNSYVQHSYEISYELYGMTCADGYLMKQTCTGCGDSYSFEHLQANCHGRDLFSIIDMSYGPCRIRLEGSTCEVCGNLCNLRSSTRCKVEYLSEEMLLDESGNTVGMAYTAVCMNCGMNYEWREYYGDRDACSILVTSVYIKIFNSEAVLFDGNATYGRYVTQHTFGYAEMYNEFHHRVYCGECGKYYGLEEHDFVLTDSQTPTCMVPGWERYECICGAERVEEIYGGDMHPWDEGVLSPDGSMITYSCLNCGTQKYEFVSTPDLPPVDPEPSDGLLVIRPVDLGMVCVGDVIRVTFEIVANPGVSGLVVTPYYGTNLHLISIENGGLFEDMYEGTNLVFNSAYDTDACGTLVTLTFRVINSGMVDVALFARECANGNLQWVDMESHAATITVVDRRQGDVNGDGVVSLTDLILLRRYLAEYDYDLGYSTVDVAHGADMNNDGVINLSDLILLSRYLADYDYDYDTDEPADGYEPEIPDDSFDPIAPDFDDDIWVPMY